MVKQSNAEYVDTIDKVIDNLKYELERRVNAYNSNQFCDNETTARHIRILRQGIIAMTNQNILEKYGYEKEVSDKEVNIIKLLEKAVEELENIHECDTDLTIKIRDGLNGLGVNNLNTDV